jgi:hypothetical protein
MLFFLQRKTHLLIAPFSSHDINTSWYCLNAVCTQVCRLHGNKIMLFAIVSISIVSLNEFKINVFCDLYPSSTYGPVEEERSKVDDSGQDFCHILDSHSKR